MEYTRIVGIAGAHLTHTFILADTVPEDATLETELFDRYLPQVDPDVVTFSGELTGQVVVLSLTDAQTTTLGACILGFVAYTVDAGERTCVLRGDLELSAP